MAATLLTLREITVRYDRSVALQIAALDLLTGEVLAIIGPNGSGKSTLLRVMGLLQRPTSGAVRFRGVDAFDGNLLHLRRRIATVFQEPLLLNATVSENAALGLKLRGFARGEIARRLHPWLERLGIAHLRRRSARTLSGGEAQRTSLARALVLEPEILLLDEPFAALDPASREALLRDFQRILNESRITSVFVTHDRNEAYGLAGRVGILHQGRLAQIDSREDVFHRPANEVVAEIVGVENRLAGIVEECAGEFTTIRVHRTKIKVSGRFKPGAKVLVCIRPENVVVGREEREIGETNQLPGVITAVSTAVIHQRLTLNCGGMPLVALVDSTVGLGCGFREQEKVTARIGFSAAHLIVDP